MFEFNEARAGLFGVASDGGFNMRVVRLAAFFFIIALVTTAIGAFAAPSANDPPAAPIPAPIFTAKKVFISNNSGEFAVPEGTPEVTYDEFYAAMQNWGRYELVSSPADADLVFEISYEFDPVPYLRLLILDKKTHFLLWPLSEQVKPWALAATGRKNFDQAMANLVDALKKMATPTSPTRDNQKN